MGGADFNISHRRDALQLIQCHTSVLSDIISKRNANLKCRLIVLCTERQRDRHTSRQRHIDTGTMNATRKCEKTKTGVPMLKLELFDSDRSSAGPVR